MKSFLNTFLNKLLE